MRRAYQESNKAGKNAVAEDGRWLIGESAIVADNDDPERQHRVRVVIPSIDENMIYDYWARQLVFCLGDGFGSAFIPPKGSEVVLFGQLGQKYNLFYASVYNEEMTMPEDFDDKKVGIKAPDDLKLIAGQSLKIEGGTQIKIDSDGSISIQGGVVSIGGDVVTIHNRLVNKTGPAI